MQFVQPILHNLKGTVSRFLEFVGEPWMAPSKLHSGLCFQGWSSGMLWLTMHNSHVQRPGNNLHQD